MKNKKQLFSLLLLVSCSLAQQTVFAAAAKDVPGSPAIDPSVKWREYAKTIKPGEKLKYESPQYNKVYKYSLSAGLNSKGEKLEGVTFEKLIDALFFLKNNENSNDLYTSMLAIVQERIYNEDRPDNVQLLQQKKGRELLTSLQQELRRLEETGQIPLQLDESAENRPPITQEDEDNILSPVYKWLFADIQEWAKEKGKAKNFGKRKGSTTRRPWRP
jgi:hypothetical protein